jgi:saccharopine dehydrogenase (NAD+, L-glutamate forming)
MLAESAVCLAKDPLEVGGGMWTPASAMGDALLARIPRAGVTFEIED